ncbi:uncharacterized protein BJX67DRAFT_366487 [Aspergillus lucknowensis]|uniref:AT hook motif protein n=1 Tax=Aspergillus lucknowensis TaxID=176173 RepID=A0ABR4LCZ6_9EURO
MPMTWNAEADAKLFLGVLNLLKDSKVKLDYDYLAKFMGSDCLPGAVQNRIVRLKRKAEEDGSAAGVGTGNGNSNGDGDGNGTANANGEDAEGPGTPGTASDASPQKKRVRKLKAKTKGAAKKVKAEDAEEAA